MRYAKNTAVSADKSKAEIERMLTRYGADQFASGWTDGSAKIMFKFNGKLIRFTLPLPNKTDKEFTHTASRHRQRPDEEAYREWERACRQRWRALALVVKAKLEAVETGITTFEEEFMAHIVMPNGRTIGESVLPQVESAIKSGKMPTVLLQGW